MPCASILLEETQYMSFTDVNLTFLTVTVLVDWFICPLEKLWDGIWKVTDLSGCLCHILKHKEQEILWRIRKELHNKDLVIISVVAGIFYIDPLYAVCGVMICTERNKRKRDQEWIFLKIVCLQSAHPFLFTSMETTGLEPGAVFMTLGSFLCEVSGSTAASGVCWEAQGGYQCLRASSWEAGSWCSPGSPSGPVRSIGSVMPSSRAHSRSFPILKHWWSNPAGRTSPRGSSLVYLCPSLLNLQVGQMVVAQVTDSALHFRWHWCQLEPTSSGKKQKKTPVLFTLLGNMSPITCYYCLCKNDNLAVKRSK